MITRGRFNVCLGWPAKKLTLVFVVEAIATFADPDGGGNGLARDGLGIIEADDNYRALDGLEAARIRGRRGDERGACVGPVIAVVGCECADGHGGNGARELNDTLNLPAHGQRRREINEMRVTDVSSSAAETSLPDAWTSGMVKNFFFRTKTTWLWIVWGSGMSGIYGKFRANTHMEPSTELTATCMSPCTAAHHVFFRVPVLS
jgi:hypothetical protein